MNMDQNECRICEYYAAVNQDAGICIYHYRTGLEKADAAAGHDDFVNAEDCCRQFRDRHRKCMYCEHYEKTKTYGIGYCKILPSAGQVQQKKRVSVSDVCEQFETSVLFVSPFDFEKR